MWRILMASMAVAAAGVAGDYREKWLVNQNQWSSAVTEAGVDPEYAREVLARCGQVFVEYSPIVNPSDARVIPQRATIAETVVWNGDEIAIYTARNPRVRNHLWIVLKRPVKEFGDVTGDEILAMRAAVNKVNKILQERCGLPCAIVAQWNETQPGQLEDRFIIEVIPPRHDSRDVHNVWDKIGCNHHVLYRDVFPEPVATPSVEEAEQDAGFWKEALQGRSVGFFPQMEPDVETPWTQVQVNRGKAHVNLVECLSQSLRDRGVDIERIEMPFDGAYLDEPMKAEIPRCLFCMERVIKTQKVFESTHFNVIYNYKPTTFGGHFLIVPKRHVKSTDKLTVEEIGEMYRIAQKLTKVLQKTLGRTDVKMYSQEGPEVGQVVRHASMHVMVTPNPIKYMIYGLNYDKEKAYTREEMEPHIQSALELMAERE